MPPAYLRLELRQSCPDKVSTMPVFYKTQNQKSGHQGDAGKPRVAALATRQVTAHKSIEKLYKK
jgi:hypothetical protein